MRETRLTPGAQERAAQEILDEVHRALVEGDFLTYDRIMSRFSPFTSCEGVLFRHAREIVADAVRGRKNIAAALDFVRTFRRLREKK